MKKQTNAINHKKRVYLHDRTDCYNSLITKKTFLLYDFTFIFPIC